MCIVLISQFLFFILFVVCITIAPLRWFMPLCIPPHSFAWHLGRFGPPKELNLILTQTPQTHTAVVREGGRKNKWMSESEWAGERERDIEKEQHPLPRSRSLCLQSLRKTFQKSTALEFRLRPLRTAADSHTHIHTYLHIYSHVNEPSLTHLSLVIHLLLQTPPAFTALHFTPNHSPPGWRDTPQCVCCAVACSHHWGSDTRKTRCYTSWPFLLIKTPSTYVLVCVNASACLPECLEYKLSPRHLP